MKMKLFCTILINTNNVKTTTHNTKESSTTRRSDLGHPKGKAMFLIFR